MRPMINLRPGWMGETEPFLVNNVRNMRDNLIKVSRSPPKKQAINGLLYPLKIPLDENI